MNPTTFRRTKLATSLSLVLGATFAAPTFAEDADAKTIEVISVTGMRSSMQESMSIKRDSAGVVDAISAEDIGKFPDTNLAESLQRITGVSISRSNGEGSEVTVRGFGADKNMVTLNGRMMPAANAFGDGDGGRQGTTRAFDFANLASESVRSVEVYKTSKAEIATGGIGATINIITAKPLNSEGFKASFGAKAINDTTNRTGSDLTPELSGIISFTNDESTWGVGLTYSHQQRDSGSTGLLMNDWRVDEWEDVTFANDGTQLTGIALTDQNSVITNAPAPGQLFAMPNNVSYNVWDTERTRDNAQLTLQWAPLDNLIATVDYTYAKNDVTQAKHSKNSWFTRTTDDVTFDTGQAVATSILISEDVGGTKDHNSDATLYKQSNKLSSIGLNLEYEVSDYLSFSLDAHDSSMESMPDGGKWGGTLTVATATPIGLHNSYDFRGDLPGLVQVNDDSIKGNGNGIDDIGDVGSQIMRSFWNSQTTDVQQIKLDGSLEFDNGRFDFGIETRSMETTQKYSQNYMPLGDWGVSNPMDIPTDLLQEYNIVGQFDDYDTSKTNQFGWTSNIVDLADWAADEYGHDYSYNPNMEQNHKVEEDTTAVYLQVAVNGELGGMTTNFLAGVRYESTDVNSTSFSLQNTSIVWLDNNDYTYELADDITAIMGGTSYDHLLPSLDFDIAITDQLKARASFSQTIARANYDQLRTAITGISTNGPAATGGSAVASASNPALVPLQSTNFDISAEYYFADTSYVSVGFYEKRVSNFIGTEQVEESHFDLRDVTAGPRAQAATAALTAGGYPVDETSLFVMTVIMDNPADFPNGADDYVPGITFGEQIAADYDVRPNSDDPVMSFLTSKPVNNKDAQLYGFELAVQHFFGDTGFGLAANYTTVNGDIGFDDAGSPSVSQFALTGLSDTANVVLMYENDDIQTRLAYNWRDEYLHSTSWGGSRSPEYVESYAQLDFNISYQVNQELSVSFEGINLTGEDSRNHGRSERQVISLYDLGSRFQLGARYTF
ncbi:MAG: TonB-dependent receptor [Thalassotalea sp.]